jgi:hypothetical protein
VRGRIDRSNSRTLEVSMRQLEFLIVQVRLRVGEEPPVENMTWNELPARARAEVIEHLAKMLRAKLERSAAGEVGDE